jgi:hypothetical protein
MGLGVCVRGANPLMCRAANRNPVAIPTRLLHVVILNPPVAFCILWKAEIEPEHHDQIKRHFKKLLVPVITKRSQRLQLFGRRPALVALALFGFPRLRGSCA